MNFVSFLSDQKYISSIVLTNLITLQISKVAFLSYYFAIWSTLFWPCTVSLSMLRMHVVFRYNLFLSTPKRYDFILSTMTYFVLNEVYFRTMRNWRRQVTICIPCCTLSWFLFTTLSRPKVYRAWLPDYQKPKNYKWLSP